LLVTVLPVTIIVHPAINVESQVTLLVTVTRPVTIVEVSVTTVEAEDISLENVTMIPIQIVSVADLLDI